MIETNKTPLFDYTRAEITAGLFVVVGLALLGYLSISVGGLRFRPRNAYHVRARFANIGDLKPRAPVKVAGVTIGRVESIHLAEFVGEVELGIGRAVHLPKDTIASISTAGLLGDAYVALSPGGATDDLKDGDRIAQTEPALNMADLVGRAAFGTSQAPAPRGDKDQDKDKDKGEGADEPAPGKPAPATKPTKNEELR
jgi:phospholipid/cholesterol/gamma-HCH transport system substrate-binding protein